MFYAYFDFSALLLLCHVATITPCRHTPLPPLLLPYAVVDSHSHTPAHTMHSCNVTPVCTRYTRRYIRYAAVTRYACYAAIVFFFAYVISMLLRRFDGVTNECRRHAIDALAAVAAFRCFYADAMLPLMPPALPRLMPLFATLAYAATLCCHKHVIQYALMLACHAFIATRY